MKIDQTARDFIDRSPLLFIASRNAEGRLDVSPRGGQPSVLRRMTEEDGTEQLLLPDLKGNRRLDTLGNILAQPEVTLLLLARHDDRILEIRARARISTDARHIRAFPADEMPPLSVLVLTPLALSLRDTPALQEALFWHDHHRAPIDVIEAVTADTRHFAEVGEPPVIKDAAEEDLLHESGVRAAYGSPSELVRNKVSRGAGPGAAGFMAEASLLVAARDREGVVAMDLHGGTPIRPGPDRNNPTHMLELPESLGGAEGEAGLLAIVPGRNETLRINGVVTPGDQPRLAPREVFFHCAASLSRSHIRDDTPPAPWTGQRRFLCTATSRETPDVMSFRLTPDDDAPLGPVTPGQYVSVSLPDDPVKPARRRSYSVSGRPQDRTLRITVRRLGAGGLSDLLHDSLTPGRPVLLGPPAGSFTLPDDDAATGPRPVVLIGAGVGMTPIVPMLDQLAVAGTTRDIWVFQAARTTGDLVLGAEVKTLATRGGARVRVITALSRADDHAACDHRGRLSAHVIAAHVPVAEAEFMICGPESFMADLRHALTEMGARPDAIRTEGFGADRGARSEAWRLRPAAQVTFAKTGQTATWTPEDGTLLDLALSLGIDVPHSCRMGDCQSCLTKLRDGTGDHPGLDFPAPAPGRLLLCCAVPDGDIVLEI